MATALITGASSGIGRELALQLAAKGFSLLLVARRQERLAELAAQLASRYPAQAFGSLPCDLADRTALNALMPRADAWLADHHEQLVLLANNAGAGFWADLKDQDAARLQQDIDLNITAVTTLSHAFVTRALAHDQPAWLLNVASLAAFLPPPHFAAYAGSKAHVLTFSRLLAHELRHTQVHVTCTCPGGVHTEFMENSNQEVFGKLGMMQADDVARLSLDALFAGKRVVIPGALNKLTLAARLLPEPLRNRAIERSMAMTVRAKNRPAKP